MPYCKNNIKKKYKGTEPSPKGLGYCASGAKVGEKRKGKDGNNWVVKKIKTGSKRWMKTYKTYTITGKRDGFGAQYQAIMSGIAYSIYHNYKYIHTPFKEINHTRNQKNVNMLNNFIGIPVSDNIIVNKKESYSKIVHNSKKPSKYYTPKVLHILRKYYYSTPKPLIDDIDIAIHIRRGNVNKKKHPKRFTSDIIYKKIIKILLKNYPRYKITIFSQGKISDFSELKNKRVSFDLNSSITKTFHSLVSAKVLITAKSSFSYSAAILNKNIIYYMNFWHKPLDHLHIIPTS